MAEVVYTERFADDFLLVHSDRIRETINSLLFLLEIAPESGSKQLPDSLVQEFGTGIRKFAVEPFDLIYEYFPEKDEVDVYALIHQKRVW